MIEILKKQRQSILIFFVIQFLLLSGLCLVVFLADVDLVALFGEESRFIYIFMIIFLDIAVTMGFFLMVFHRVEDKMRLNYINIASTLGVDIRESYSFAQVGLFSYDESNEIIWTNELLDERDIKIIGEDWTKLYPQLAALLVDDKKEVMIEIMSRTYTVRLLPEMKLFMLRDVSDYNKLEKSFREGAPLVIQILIDNYQDLSSVVEDDTLNEAISKVKDRLFSFAGANGILLSRQRNDSFFGFLNEVSYQKILSERFAILEEVRRMGTKSNPLTLSIGIGRGTTNMMKLGELSSTALDVALSRGGDQVVVSTYGKSLEFFGGKSDSRGTNSKVRTRVLTQAFLANLEHVGRVVIMMHTQADLDAIGAALGIYTLCQSQGVNAKIVYDEKLVEGKTRNAVKASFSKSQLASFTISPQAAAEGVKGEDLLVLVDVHRPSITMAPKLIDLYEKIAIIDHHRRQEEYVSDTVFSLIEPASSSTCEIVAQFFKASPHDVDPGSEIATLMLAGIIVDTNNYHRGADARTYESAMILREFGADIEKANSFLADEYEEFILRSRILAGATTPVFGILLATGQEEDIVTRTLIAKVADEGIAIRGINAIFVIGRTKVDEVSLSCRSNSQFNVQLVAEKLGGGGHFSGAAAQFKDETIESVKKRLLDQLSRQAEEERKAK